MLKKIRKTFFQSFQVFFIQFIFRNTSMVFQSSDSCYKNYRIRFQTCHATFDIQEFLCTQIRTKTGFRNRIIPQFHCHPGSGNRVASMGNIGKWTAMNKGRCCFQGLNQIRFEGIFQQGSHCSLCLKLSGCDRFVVIGITDNDPGKSLLEVIDIASQTKDCHDLTGHRDDKMILSDKSVSLAAKTDHDIPQCTVIHIFTSLPHYLFGIDAKLIALLDVIVEECRQQIVCSGDGMEVTGKVEV